MAVIVGEPETIPPTLGQHFETISIIALLAAILAVSLTIGKGTGAHSSYCR